MANWKTRDWGSRLEPKSNTPLPESNVSVGTTGAAAPAAAPELSNAVARASPKSAAKPGLIQRERDECHERCQERTEFAYSRMRLTRFCETTSFAAVVCDP